MIAVLHIEEKLMYMLIRVDNSLYNSSISIEEIFNLLFGIRIVLDTTYYKEEVKTWL